MARTYPKPYKWYPTHPEKYVGDVNNIVLRSSWEKKVVIWLDTTPSIIKWNSEDKKIPYLSPVDGKMHNYHPDFCVVYKDKVGNIKRAMLEVKPFVQTQEPKKPKNQTKSYVSQVETYLVNCAKWKNAKEWCDKNGFEFRLITENELFN